MPPLDEILNAFATYFVTIDPPGLAAILLGLTASMTNTQRRSIALRGTLLGIGILVVFSFVGALLLQVLGITMPAFRVAGGLLLFYIASEMVFEKRSERREETAEKAVSDAHAHNLAVFPIAVPMIAGPGAISASVLLSSQFEGAAGQAVHIGIIVTVGLMVYLAMLLADRLHSFIPDSAANVLTRLLGILLAALSVQFIADGIKDLFL